MHSVTTNATGSMATCMGSIERFEAKPLVAIVRCYASLVFRERQRSKLRRDIKLMHAWCERRSLCQAQESRPALERMV